MEAFCYRWTDHQEDKYYVGYHTGAVGDGYVCSSKVVNHLMSIRPETFTREILAEGTREEMYEYETKVLLKDNAKYNEKFYNGSNNEWSAPHKVTGTGKVRLHGLDRTVEQSRGDISQAEKLSEMTGERRSLTQREADYSLKMRTGDNHPMKGKTFRKKATTLCEHCGKFFNKSAHTRFHGDNCKSVRD